MEDLRKTGICPIHTMKNENDHQERHQGDKMTEQEKAKLLEVVEQLALQSVMVEPEDMAALGAILESLEAIEKMSTCFDLDPIGPWSGSLKQLVEKIILRECPDLQKGLDLLGKGVRLIQQRLSHAGSSLFSSEEESFRQRIDSLLLGAPEPQKTTHRPLMQEEELYRDFISEALEHLGTIELNLINLEQSPDDKECLNAIFRPFHTVKGVSGFLNLQTINKFSHAMESLLDEARNGRLSIRDEIVDFILEAVDLLKGMILDLKSHIEGGQAPQEDPFDLDPYLEKIALLKQGGSIAPSLGPVDTETMVPPLGEILKGSRVISNADVHEVLKEQMAGETDLKFGQILVKESKAKPKEVVEALRDQKRLSAQSAETSVRVNTEKLDSLVDLVGELVIAQSLVEQNSAFAMIRDRKLINDFSHLKRITTDLQKISLSLRMVPIRQTLQKMIRLVRDLSKKSGKGVDLVMSGEETEIDRNMVESLYDPLVHMIRNAIDHGIELPARRKEIGKDEVGRIFLKAYQKGGNVIIEIEDDGQGLNRTKILKKAEARGLVSGGASLTDYQIDNLIFEPGFSTADQVTDISGRGVGMDVVKRTVDKLKGKVEIVSVEGKGCRFVMRVPLTLAIMDGIVVQIGADRYIIPTVFVKETLKPRPEDVSTVLHKGSWVKVRDSLLPLIRLHHLLGTGPEKCEPWENLVVVVENERSQRGLMVDDVLGKQEVVIKNLGEKLSHIKVVSGATIMGDGRVGLILDIHSLFENGSQWVQ